jgi:hypothetical protein
VGDVTVGWGLILLTILLVAAGCMLYIGGQVGWAQLAWVLGSGTAGAGVVLLLDEGRR